MSTVYQMTPELRGLPQFDMQHPTVRVALFKGTSAVSQTIRLINWSEYSHAALILRDGTVVEAWTQGGVRQVYSLSDRHTPGTKVDLFHADLTRDQADMVETFALSQLGKPYDFRGVLHFITRRPEQADAQKMWFCSELVIVAFVYAGVPLLVRIPAWKVYPGLLAYSPLLTHEATVLTD